MSEPEKTSACEDGPPDFYNQIAVSRGCPAGWQWLSLDAVGADRKTGGVVIKGGVFSSLLKSGKNKGKPNFAKADAGTAREILVTFADLDAFREQWERDSGKCYQCGGSGETVASSGVAGRTFTKCRRCRGTGRPS